MLTEENNNRSDNVTDISARSSLDLTNEEDTSTNAPVASASAAPQATTHPQKTLAPRIKVFTGEMLDRVPRTVTVKVNGVGIQQKKVLQGPAGLVLQAVVGHGHFENTGEIYVTVSGQYAPGKTARITVSAQNFYAFRDAILKDNMDPSSGTDSNGQRYWPLIKEVVVDAFGTPMRGRGFLIEELHLHGEGDEVKTIIGLKQGADSKAGLTDIFT